jgi:uncharacterized membrane protein
MSVAFLAWALPGGLVWNRGLQYALGALTLALGLVVILRDKDGAQGLAKIIRLAPLFIAVPMAVFSGDHFVFIHSIATMVPAWIPWKLFWAYFVGFCLLGGGLSIALNKYAGLSAAMFGIMMWLFVILMDIPGVIQDPHDRFGWALMFREATFGAGALAYAATQTEEWKIKGTHWILPVARFVIGIPLVFYAIEQFMHPLHVPAPPLDKVVPPVVPLHMIWSPFSGVVFLIAGAALLINKQTRLAAASAGLITLIVILFLYLPMLVQNAADINNGLNFFADTLLLAGCYLAFASSQPKTLLPVAAHQMEKVKQGIAS